MYCSTMILSDIYIYIYYTIIYLKKKKEWRNKNEIKVHFLSLQLRDYIGCM